MIDGCSHTAEALDSVYCGEQKVFFFAICCIVVCDCFLLEVNEVTDDISIDPSI